MEHLWQIIEPPPCVGAITLSGAGFIDAATNVNADYCPNGDVNGKPSWVRVGGDPDSTADSIFWQTTGSPQWEVYRAGTLVYTNPDGALRPKNGSWVPAFAPPDQPPVWSNRVDIVIREVFPTCGAGDFEEVQDLGAGQIFYRWKITHSLTFIKDDFKWFEGIERRNRCGELRIRYQYRCAGVWRTHWVGRFSVGGGRMYRTGCQFEVRPETVDRYTCILDALNTKVNALAVAPVTASAAVVPSLEWGGALSFAVPSPCNRSYRVELDGGGMPTNGWGTASTYTFPSFIGGILIYWRERLITLCVGGVPQVPPGSGWTLLVDNCGADGTATYVRPPTISYTFGDPVEGTCVDGVAIPPDSSCNWVQVMDCQPDDCPATEFAGPWFVCYEVAGTEYSRARTLQAITEHVVAATGCGTGGVRSDFFEWNAPGTAEGYAPGVNYVTGNANQMNAIVVLQNSDAIDPTATNPATLGELTLKELFAFFLSTFRVYWDLESDGGLRLESRKHWTFPVGLDLTTLVPPQEVSEIMEHSGLNRDIPKIERLRFPHAQGQDFIGADLTYSGPCVTDNEGAAVKEYTVGPFTSDITFVQTDPAAISRQGFTILATAFDGSTYSTIIDTGAMSGNAVTNAPLSVANLQRDYWGWDRYLPEGNVNGQDVEFNAFLPTVKQPEVIVKCFICHLKNFDAKKRVRTGLGKKYLQGATAEVEKAGIDPHGHLRLTLRYAR